MNKKAQPVALATLSGLFLLLDQGLKFLARTNQGFQWTVFDGWLGWEYLANPGVAFGLPIPNTIILFITPLILLGLFTLYGKKKRSPWYSAGLFLIVFGAVSNYIDRILFGVTIDYLRFFTSIINIADVMIVLGAGLLIMNEGKKR